MEITIKFKSGKSIQLTGDEFAELFGRISMIELPGDIQDYPYEGKFSADEDSAFNFREPWKKK